VAVAAQADDRRSISRAVVGGDGATAGRAFGSRHNTNVGVGLWGGGGGFSLLEAEPVRLLVEVGIPPTKASVTPANSAATTTAV